MLFLKFISEPLLNVTFVNFSKLHPYVVTLFFDCA